MIVSLFLQLSGVQGLANPTPPSTSSSNPPDVCVPVGGMTVDEKQKTKVAYQHLLPELLTEVKRCSLRFSSLPLSSP